jgi:MarR family transcriptional regulator, negative regulator of the multidrug operon emrRAB
MQGAYRSTKYASCIVNARMHDLTLCTEAPMNRDDRRDNMLGAFVLSVGDRLRRETEEAIGHTGASPAALIMIAEFPDRTIEFLRRSIGLSHPATVRVVDRLVEQKLVRRWPAGPGPAVALRATAAGKRQARRVLEIRQRVLADSLPELSPAESATLVAILERALGRLSESPGTTHCRLCDMKRCPWSDCPVIHKQIELGTTPPKPVPVPD